MKRLWKSFSFALICFFGGALGAFDEGIQGSVTSNGHTWGYSEASAADESSVTVCICTLEDDDPVGNLVIPSRAAGYTVTEIDIGHTFDWQRVTGLTIPSTVNKLVLYSDESQITSINLPANLLYLDIDLPKLQSISLPNGLLELDLASDALTSLTLPGSLTTFSGACPLVKTLNIPASCSEVGFGWFDFPALENITVAAQNTEYSAANNVLYDKDKTSLYFIGAKHATFTVPDSVTRISIFGKLNVTSLTLGKNVSKISKNSFAKYMPKLTSVTVDPANENFYMNDGCLYDKNGTRYWGTPGGGSTVSLSTAIDNTSLSFTTGGSASWTGQTSVSHDGIDAAKSGQISDGQQTYFQTTVSGAGTIGFWWKVSSESNYDKLHFYVDGQDAVNAISGENGWTYVSKTLSSGSHTLKWTYEKDGSTSTGSDCGWVDQVVWTPQGSSSVVTITFNANGGCFDPEGGRDSTWTKTATAGSQYGSLPNPGRSFYKFDGWYTSVSGGTRIAASTVVSGSSHTLYAHWTEDFTTSISTSDAKIDEVSDGLGHQFYVHPVVLVPGEGTGAPRLTHALWEYASIPANIFSKTGASFSHWKVYDACHMSESYYQYMGIGGGYVGDYSPGSSFEFCGFTALVAQWRANAQSVTVTFNANGGSGGTTRTVTSGSEIGSLPTPTRNGYSFDGWYTSASGGLQIYYWTTVSGNVTYYAHWTKISTTCNITFNANGGSVSPSSMTVATGETIQEFDGWYNASNLPIPEKSGKSFDGWWTAASGGTRVEFGMDVTDDITLYAHWVALTYKTVTFDANGGTVSEKSRQVALYTPIGTLPQPSRQGYKFVGWYLHEMCSFPNLFSPSKLVTKDLKLVAEYEEASYVTVNFNANGGSVSESSRSVEQDTAVGNLPTPTRSGYTFAGWYTSSSGGSQVSASTTVSGNVTYYARWNVNTYTVTFNANGGSGGTTRSVSYGSAVGTLPTPTKAGYSFAGWYTSASGGSQISSSTTISGNVTYYAHWTAKTYTVTFNANGGSCSQSSKSVTYDSTYGNLPTPTRNGYKFDGWYTSASGGTKIESETRVGITAPQTLYAHWIEVVNDVVIVADGGQYLVIDLSEGPSAMSYPVSYLDGIPAGGWTDEYKTTKLALRKIERGSFKMQGTTTTTLTKPFYIGVFEVTQKQWERVMGKNPSANNANNPKCPVDSVSYDMIRGSSQGAMWPIGNSVDGDSFLGKLRVRTNFAFDLPTEAQWEYACRAGTSTAYSYGNRENGDYMWYQSNASSKTHDVGTKNPNQWGLYDMHGNVWEWCLDWQGELAYGTDPHGAITGPGRIYRGGGCKNSGTWTRALVRPYLVPSRTYGDGEGDVIGLRVIAGGVLGKHTLPTPTKLGYSFAGWWTSASGGTQISTSTTVGSDVTCYAHWNANTYTVTFDANGGTGGKSVTLDYGTALSAPVVSRTGYTFKGWSPSVPSTVPAGNITYTAQWQINRYTVTFDANGGTGGKSEMQNYGTAIRAPTVTRIGYTFKGWSTSVAATVPANDLTYTAQWTPNRYTVKFGANGGNGKMDDQPMTYDEPTQLSAVGFAKADSYFRGWATSSDGAMAYKDQASVTNLTAVENGVVTLYATWRKKPASMLACEAAFGGTGAISMGDDGYVVVTLTNDVSGTVEIPDNVGCIMIDLNGHSMTGSYGGAAILVTAGDGAGDATRLAIGDTSEGGNGQIVGDGEGVGIEFAEDASFGVRIDVDEGVMVLNGDGTAQEVRPKLVGSGTVTVPKTWKTGQKVTWKAKSDKGSVFTRWEGPLVASLNLTKNEWRNPSLAFTVPAGFETNQITAVFIPIDDDRLSRLDITQTEFALKAAVDGVMMTDDSESYVTASVSGLPTGLKFDAKTMRITGAPTKGGIFWAQVKAKNASGYQWTENVKITVSGDGKEAKEPKLTRTAYYPLTVICATVGGTATGTGVYAEGKKAAIRATAAKGYVFAGWYEDWLLTRPAAFAAGDFRATSQSVAVPEMRYVFARFELVKDDNASVALAVNRVEMAAAVAGHPPYKTNVICGVYMEWPVAVNTLSLPTVAVAGLPSGLKFTAKDIVDSKTKQVTVPANTIYGIPTAASKVDKKTGAVTPSVVKVTVTTAGKTKVVYEIDVTVDPLPAWAAGTFDGALWNSEEGIGNSEKVEGVVSLTVAANGKISGKLIDSAGTWTLTAASYSTVESPSSNVDDSVFHAAVVAKCGKLVTTNEVMVASEDMAASGQPPCLRGVVTGWPQSSAAAEAEECRPSEWTSWQNLWKTEPWKTMAKPFAKAPAQTIDLGTRDACPYLGTIALKFAATGAVAASGKFVTGQNPKTGKDVVYSASCSSVLVPIESNIYACYLYFPPKAGKFDGYADVAYLYWNGGLWLPLDGATPSLTDGLVAYYPFDGNANDASGNGNHGVVHGATLTTDRFGNANYAYSFTGDDCGYIEVPNSTGLQSITQRITISAWIKPSKWVGEYYDGDIWIPIVCKGTNNRQYGVQLRKELDGTRFDLKDEYGVSVYSSCTIELGVWQNIVVTYDGTLMCAYLNGECVGSNSVGAEFMENFDGLFIGRDYPGGAEDYYGAMDDLRIYNRTLSAEEVKALYEGTSEMSAVTPVASDMVQLWEGGPYWATTNIGAENPEDYGYYFWWGDTVGYRRENDKWVASDGSSSDFSFGSSNTPTYGKDIATLQKEGWITADGILVPERDAAHVHWGGEWRMPTDAEFSDLINNCTTTWTTQNGVYGRLVTGKGEYANRSIFLPAAGDGSGSGLSDPGSDGHYWSSTPLSDYSNDAWSLYFDSSYVDRIDIYRFIGRSVRPVRGFAE